MTFPGLEIKMEFYDFSRFSITGNLFKDMDGEGADFNIT